MTKFGDHDYAEIAALGDEHRSQFPRRIAESDAAERTVVSATTSPNEITIEMEAGGTRSMPLFGRLIGASRVARETSVLSGDGTNDLLADRQRALRGWSVLPRRLIRRRDGPFAEGHDRPESPFAGIGNA